MTEKGDQDFLQDLGEGLVLRRARQEDTETLVAFNTRIHEEEDPGLAERAVPKTAFQYLAGRLRYSPNVKIIIPEQKAPRRNFQRISSDFVDNAPELTV